MSCNEGLRRKVFEKTRNCMLILDNVSVEEIAAIHDFLKERRLKEKEG